MQQSFLENMRTMCITVNKIPASNALLFNGLHSARLLDYNCCNEIMKFGSENSRHKSLEIVSVPLIEVLQKPLDDCI